MKTVKEVDTEINEIIRSLNKNSSDSEIKSAKRQVVFLREIKRYLETNPREEFIKSELIEVQRKIDLIPSHYKDWQIGKVLTKYKDPYSTYCSEMGLTNLKTQIKTLNYIING